MLGSVGSAKRTLLSDALRATSVIFSHLPAKREGEMHSRGFEGGMNRAVGENLPACRVVRLNESHQFNVCQELVQANNVVCRGADWKGN